MGRLAIMSCYRVQQRIVEGFPDMRLSIAGNTAQLRSAWKLSVTWSAEGLSRLLRALVADIPVVSRPRRAR
jgi:hypothetical protein